MSSTETRVIHIHIPKTAGTAIRDAFARSNSTEKIFPHYDERKYSDAVADDFDLFSGHFGYDTAKRLGGRIISVFRNPFDRFVSVYYFWRELHEKGIERNRKTALAMNYSLDQFVLISDEFSLVEEFQNRVTWQVACGSSIAHRQHYRNAGKTEEDIYNLASENLRTFSLIGLQDRLSDFSHGLETNFGISLNIRQVNVTKQRLPLSELSMNTRRRIYDWIYMDLALYEQADALSFRHPQG